MSAVSASRGVNPWTDGLEKNTLMRSMGVVVDTEWVLSITLWCNCCYADGMCWCRTDFSSLCFLTAVCVLLCFLVDVMLQMCCVDTCECNTAFTVLPGGFYGETYIHACFVDVHTHAVLSLRSFEYRYSPWCVYFEAAHMFSCMLLL